MSAPAGVEVYETASLADLEAVVQAGLDTFVDVGLALTAIKERGLYRETHRSWESYVQERWELDRTYAARIMAAARVTSALPIGNRPQNESQARPLTSLPPEQAQQAWEAAVEETDGHPTAGAVKRAAKSLARGAKGEEQPEPGPPPGPRSAPPPGPTQEPSPLTTEATPNFAEHPICRFNEKAKDIARFLTRRPTPDRWQLIQREHRHVPAENRAPAATVAREQAGQWTRLAELLDQPVPIKEAK